MKDVYVVYMESDGVKSGLCYYENNDIFQTQDLYIANAFRDKLATAFEGHKTKPLYTVCRLVPLE